MQTDTSKKNFVIIEGDDELQEIMQEPLEKWRIFLHPTQRKVVKKHFNGPARILGGAGTGKLLLRCTEQKNWLGHYNQGKRYFLQRIQEI